MLTDKDIEKLTKVLASKADFNALETRLTLVETRLDGVVTALDGLSSTVSNLRLEYISITNQLDRHESSITMLLNR